MDLATFERLLLPEGQELLAAIAERTGTESDLQVGTRLRRSHDTDLVAAALSQAALRVKAASKFGADASVLYFTPDALEQATRRSVADHRAARLRDDGTRAVVDAGCGIGADLLACARAGLRVRGIERDPVRAAIARANLAALGFTGTVVVGDATSVLTPADLAADEAAFIDPARRTERGRVFGTADLQPPWPWVTALLHGSAVAKVMPGIAHGDVPAGIEAEWVSDRGQLVECCLWGRAHARTDRCATVLPSGAQLEHRGQAPAIGPVGAYLYEPDDAVIRSGTVAEFAAAVGGWLPDPQIAYVSSDRGTTTPLGRRFRVLEELPFREKKMRAALRERGIGTLTIKKRGVQVVPEELVRRLKLTGTRVATLVLTRVDGAGRAFLVEPTPDH